MTDEELSRIAGMADRAVEIGVLPPTSWPIDSIRLLLAEVRRLQGSQPSSDAEAAETIGRGLKKVADSITAEGAPGRDEAGGTVASLTEAVMGMTAGLIRVAEAIGELAQAVRENELGGAVRDVADAIDRIPE